jgi:hypothetical protein
MGLNNNNCSAIDYMLGTISIYYLLFNIHNLIKIDRSRSFNLLLNSKNDNNTVSSFKQILPGPKGSKRARGFAPFHLGGRKRTGIQSAGN